MLNVRTRDHVIFKMAKLPKASVSLVMWALSPRLRGSFNNSFEFEFLGGIRTMSISENTNTSIKVMDSLLRLANIDQDEALRKFITRPINFLTTQLRLYRHAECILIHHLTDLRRKSFFYLIIKCIQSRDYDTV